MHIDTSSTGLFISLLDDDFVTLHALNQYNDTSVLALKHLRIEEEQQLEENKAAKRAKNKESNKQIGLLYCKPWIIMPVMNK